MQEIECQIKPSRQFLGVIIAMEAVCLCTLLYWPLHFTLKFICIFITLIYGRSVIKRYCFLQGQDSIRAFQLPTIDYNHWLLFPSQGEPKKAFLRGDSTLTAWVSVLRFYVSSNKKTYSCLLFRDALEPNQYRRLMALITTLNFKKIS